MQIWPILFCCGVFSPVPRGFLSPHRCLTPKFCRVPPPRPSRGPFNTVPLNLGSVITYRVSSSSMCRPSQQLSPRSTGSGSSSRSTSNNNRSSSKTSLNVCPTSHEGTVRLKSEGEASDVCGHPGSSMAEVGGPSKCRRRLKTPAKGGVPRQKQLRALSRVSSQIDKPKSESTDRGAPAGAFCAAAAAVAPADEGLLKDTGVPWRDLRVPAEELRPSACLMTEDGVWEGLVGRRVFQIKEEANTTLFRCVFDAETEENGPKGDPLAPETSSALLKQEEALRRFFQLDISVANTLKTFGFSESLGVRVLAIDPLECLFSFICSSNNNISRISTMVRRLCEAYGPLLIKGNLKDPPGASGSPRLTWHAFPSLSSLAASSVDDLRKLGLGYRSRLVHQSALLLEDLGGTSYLDSLRWQGLEPEGPPFSSLKAATAALMQLPGVGRKVADCVALYGLGFAAAWPVDRHLLQHALDDKALISHLRLCRETGDRAEEISVVWKHLGRKQLSPVLYSFIQAFYQNKYGSVAGWVQSAVFFRALRRTSAQK